MRAPRSVVAVLSATVAIAAAMALPACSSSGPEVSGRCAKAFEQLAGLATMEGADTQEMFQSATLSWCGSKKEWMTAAKAFQKGDAPLFPADTDLESVWSDYCQLGPSEPACVNT